jgi:Helix-turn-helix domain
MPRAIPFPIRQTIWQRFRDGQEAPVIAAALGLSPRTVRHLLCRFQRGGLGALEPSLDSCGQATPKPSETLVKAVLEMRRDHPGWGGKMIRVMLRRQGLGSDSPLPTARTLQRWLERAEANPAPAGRRPKAESLRATRPHEVWQMDASEWVPLRSGHRISWLRLVDEASGAVLWTAVFPPRALAPCAAQRHPSRTPQGVHPMGPPPTPAGGQRRAVGFLG